METEADRQRLFARRALMIGAGQAVLACTLVGRMYWLSVVQGGQYKVLADENRLSLRLLAPVRGRIVDRFGRDIAGNRQDLRVVLIPEQTADVEHTLDVLTTLVALDPAERTRILRQIKRQRRFVPVTVAENLDWETFARINVESPRLPGVQTAAGASRDYPDGVAMAHVVGHVGAVSEADDVDDPVLQLPGFKIGKMGVEQAFDDRLRGAAGTSRVEVNAFGRVIREVAREESRPGDEIRLTLAAELQTRIAARLGEESASAVLIDVRNGDILTQVSMPAFDPNAFSVGISHDYWKSLLADPRTPLVNKCLGGLYPPGSTVKPGVALAALRSGEVDPAEKFFCGGKLRLGDHLFHCWKKEGHGHVDMHGGILHSCDIYFYNVAIRLGIDRLASELRAVGLGQDYGLPVAGEKAGLVPNAAWKRAIYGRPWTGGETLNAAIGQGYMLTTPMQLAVMTARLASGKAVVPRLIADGPAPGFADLGVPAAHLSLVQSAMADVVNLPGGTAFGARIRTEGHSMAGKTGTAQVRRISLAERQTGVRKNEEKPWIERDHALFIGFGPVIEPRFAVAVVVEHGGGGSKVAAPIARDILDWAQGLDLDGLARGISLTEQG